MIGEGVGAAPGDGSESGLTVGRFRDRRVALGVSVSAIAADPSFAQLGFGQIARILIGQVNRGDYLVALEGNETTGLVGWVRTRESEAEGWLRGGDATAIPPPPDADCAILNVWMSRSDWVRRHLLRALRRELADCRMVFARRVYPDGSVRIVRVPNARATARRPAGG